jgi:hypothetical protein
MTKTKFLDDGAAASTQQSDDLADGLFGCQEDVNLVVNLLAVVLVHLFTWT